PRALFCLLFFPNALLALDLATALDSPLVSYSLGLSFGFNIILRNLPPASHPPSPPCSFPLLVRGLCDGTVRVDFGVG
ncbi:hypothetical protein BKA80DRAFT_279264, partial [Phyllosticta citrichinensis]